MKSFRVIQAWTITFCFARDSYFQRRYHFYTPSRCLQHCSPTNQQPPQELKTFFQVKLLKFSEWSNLQRNLLSDEFTEIREPTIKKNNINKPENCKRSGKLTLKNNLDTLTMHSFNLKALSPCQHCSVCKYHRLISC